MTGWKIFTHSLNMVLRNWREALRIALVPAFLAAILMATVIGGVMSTGVQTDAGSMPAMMAPLFLGIVMLLILELWVFVNWHRFVLLEEYPSGWIPPFRASRILAYVGVSLLLLLAVGMVASVVLGIIGGLAAAGAPQVFAMTLATAAVVTIGVFAFRLLPMLPAAAIGKRLTISQSLLAMRGTTGTAVMLFVVLVAVQFALQFVVLASQVVFAPLGFLFSIGAALVMSLVNVSILTTLYGHYIEGRPI